MKYKVVHDTREKHGWYFDEILDASCEGTVVKKLDTGDYSLEGYENLLSIERKGSISEFAANITDKRFYDELERLDKFKFAYLILEFELEDVVRYPEGSDIPKSRWGMLKVKSEYILSSLLSLQHKYGNIKVVFAGRFGKDIAKTIFRKVMRYVEKTAIKDKKNS